MNRNFGQIREGLRSRGRFESGDYTPEELKRLTGPMVPSTSDYRQDLIRRENEWLAAFMSDPTRTESEKRNAQARVMQFIQNIQNADPDDPRLQPPILRPQMGRIKSKAV